MTFYEFIRYCLHIEAMQTEPDSKKAIQKIIKEIEKWKKNK